MNICNWHNWAIRARISVLTLIPLVMIVVVIFWSYFSRLGEIHQDLEERGNLIAFTLAQSSQYGVMSGNLAYLKHTIQSLLKKDKSIFRVEVLDTEKKLLIHFTNNTSFSNSNMQVFEAPIIKEWMVLDPFDTGNIPHISGATDEKSSFQKEKIIGYVRVTMSPAAMMESKRNRILTALSIAFVFLLLSIILGIFLAHSLSYPLRSTIAALRHIREGKYDIQLEATTGGEIGLLQTTIVDMASRLYQLRQNLEGKVIERTKALEEARDEALKANTETRRLIQQINSAVEEERKNIASEMHDQLNASLIVARLQAQQILKQISKEPASETNEAVKNKAQLLIQLTNDLYTLCRNIVRRLRPEIIDMLGLQGAIEEMIHFYDKNHPDCRFTLHTIGDFSHLEGDLPMIAYRLIQEALSNVVKHAQATEVNVHLQLIEEKKTVHIEIRDNGKGFDLQSTEPGIGLIGMRERVYALKGAIQILAKINEGTEVIIDLQVR